MKDSLDVIVLPAGDDKKRGIRFPRFPWWKLRVALKRLLAVLKKLGAFLRKRLSVLLKTLVKFLKKLVASLKKLVAFLRKKLPALRKKSVAFLRSELSALRKKLPALREKLRIPLRLAFVCLCLAGLYLGAIVLADPLLAVRSEAKPSDVIVVLGGDGPTRADLGAALFNAGLAPKMLVTGDGDCAYIAQKMTQQGVDPASIGIECRSGNTAENAAFSQPILSAMKIRRAILVTSWFHSRRALATFEAVMPSIQWVSVPTEPPDPFWRLAQDHRGLQVVKEYPKTVVYALRRLLGWTTDTSALAGEINWDKGATR